MLGNWETFSSTLISDPFLDEAEKFKDDFESTTTEFCDSLDSLSNEPISSKSSVTSLEPIYSYSVDDSDSLDDRAASSSTLNSIYDINPLDDNDVFAPDLSLFDESSTLTNSFNSTWNPKATVNEISKTSVEKSLKPSNESTSSLSTASNNVGTKILRVSEPSSAKLQPILLQPESKIIKMTVVSAATPVHEAIKAAGIGLHPSTHFKTIKVINQHPKRQQQIPTRIVVIKKPVIPATPTTAVTTTTMYMPFRNANNIFSRSSRVYWNQKIPDSNNEWESDMPVLTREAPFRPEQLSSSSKRTTFASTSSSRPYQIFECPKCQKNLPSKHALAKHLHIHDPPRYKCSQCEKMFYDRTKLRRHQIVHSAEKRYECGICGSKFSLEQNLRVHMRIHQGLTSYFCEECKHGFTQLANFINHVHVNSQKPIRKLPSILKASTQ